MFVDSRSSSVAAVLALLVGCSSAPAEQSETDDDGAAVKTDDAPASSFVTTKRDLAWLLDRGKHEYLYPDPEKISLFGNAVDGKTRISWTRNDMATIFELPTKSFAYKTFSTVLLESSRFDTVDGNDVVLCAVRANEQGVCNVGGHDPHGLVASLTVNAADGVRWLVAARASIFPDGPKDVLPKGARTASLTVTWETVATPTVSNLPRAPR